MRFSHALDLNTVHNCPTLPRRVRERDIAAPRRHASHGVLAAILRPLSPRTPSRPSLPLLGRYSASCAVLGGVS